MPPRLQRLDPGARPAFYRERGFSPDLTVFPPAAFHASFRSPACRDVPAPLDEATAEPDLKDDCNKVFA